MNKIKILIILITALIPLQALGDMTLLDDFNRPDSPDLGSNWTDQEWGINSVRIQDNSLIGKSGTGGLITYNGVTSSIASVDVFAGSRGDTFAAGITMRYLDNGNNLFVKVQDNTSSGYFNRLFFYYFYQGEENDQIPTSVKPYYFDFTPFSSAKMTLSVFNNVAKVDLDTNFDGNAEMTYEYNGVPTDLGTGIGLITYGPARLDNFMASIDSPPPPTPPDTLITPVPGATYTNPTMDLPNSNPDSEKMFLANILGLDINDPSLTFLGKNDYNERSLEEKIALNWLYAVVKSDGKNDGWYAFMNNGDDYLKVGPFAYDISHVSFFGYQPVPIPAAFWLFGSGLLGLFEVRRKIRK